MPVEREAGGRQRRRAQRALVDPRIRLLQPLGRAREGWGRQTDYFKLPAYATPGVKSCFAAVRADLRGKLGVPADWP